MKLNRKSVNHPWYGENNAKDWRYIVHRHKLWEWWYDPSSIIGRTPWNIELRACLLSTSSEPIEHIYSLAAVSAIFWYICRFELTPWLAAVRCGVSSHRRLDCLLNRLFMRRSKKTQKPRVTGLCGGKPSVICKAKHKHRFWIHFTKFICSCHLCIWRPTIIKLTAHFTNDLSHTTLKFNRNIF